MCVAWCHRCVWAAKCGYALANAGHDTQALQAYLGHKNIQHTVRYTELSPHRFKYFWPDVEEWIFDPPGGCGGQSVGPKGGHITTLSCPHTSMAPSHTHRWHIPKHDAGSADAVSSSIEGGVDRCPMAAQRSVAAPHWPAAACSKGLD